MLLRRLSVNRLFLLACGLLPALSACTAEMPQTTLTPKSYNAQAIFDLFEPIFWMAVAVFFIVEAMLIYSVFRFRTRDDAKGIPEQLHGNEKLEITWTIIPAIILGVIFFMTLNTLNIVHTPPASAGSALNVRIIGHQWWWEFQYPDVRTADGKVLSTANDLHVPASAVVNYTLETVDVIHSFWVPHLGGKMDLVPGKVNRFYFVAPAQGHDFFGQCAEFCGAQHANMRFITVVDGDSDYQAWLKNQQAVAATPTSADARLGADLFARSGCVACHNINGAVPVTDGKIGPNLTHVASRKTIAGGTLANNKANLSKWLHNPEAIKPGNAMAATMKGIVAGWGADADKNIAALVEYLSSLK